jgi:ATP-dependent DNA ligase
MNYPKLYSRDSKDGIRVWWAEVEGDKYRQHYGLLDGKIITTAWSYAEVKNFDKKNQTTAEEQAVKETEALIKKQLKTGYHEKLEDIDNQQFVEPMLAKKFEDRKDKIEYPVGLQCKLNGSRCIATSKGLFTRKGEKYISVPHIENSLRDFFKKWPDAVLDGELLGDGFKTALNETMKLVRKTVHVSAEDLEKSEKLVKYWVYDAYGFCGIDKKTPYRNGRAPAIYEALKNNPYYRPVNTIMCRSEEEVYKEFDKLVANQEEGAIIRILDKPYENKRSSFLLKLKPEDDGDAIIVDITEGSADWAGTGKRITLNWNGKIFDATLKGSYEEAREFLQNKHKYIGREVEFLYMGLTGLGTPNYARVDYNNCFKK